MLRLLILSPLEFWLPGMVGWGGVNIEKDFDVWGLRAAGSEKLESFKDCCAKTPPSVLEGGVGRPTRQLACCLQRKAPWCLVSGWGVLSLGHNEMG